MALASSRPCTAQPMSWCRAENTHDPKGQCLSLATRHHLTFLSLGLLPVS